MFILFIIGAYICVGIGSAILSIFIDKKNNEDSDSWFCVFIALFWPIFLPMTIISFFYSTLNKMFYNIRKQIR